MIRSLEVQNLKSLGGAQAVDFAPITLIYGPNSAGKSSLLQALAVLKQTLEPRAARIDIERQPLNLRGDLVDLGSFGAAVHQHDLETTLGFGLEFDAVPGRPRPRQLRRHMRGYVSLNFGFNPKTHAVDQRDVTVGTGNHRVRYLPAEAPREQQEIFPTTEGFLRVASRDDGRALVSLAGEFFPPDTGRHDEVVASVEDFLDVEARPYFYARGFFPFGAYLRPLRERKESPRGGPVGYLAQRLNDAVHAPAQALIEVVSQMAYLGPLRAAPTRFQARSGEIYASVGSRGEHTPLLLLQEPKLVRPVNEWLTKLGIHYELRVAPIESESIGLEIGDLIVTRLVDRRSGIVVTPQDVGFGISQLLPVVVQVLAGQGRTICVEQPEIHIHPRLQAELGDLLIEAASQNRNQVIVETHSEHLMLRLQKRLREARGDSWLTPDKIRVLYVDHDELGVARPVHLRLDDSGAFLDEWPHGFFSERLDELFSSTAPPRRRSPSKPRADQA